MLVSVRGGVMNYIFACIVLILFSYDIVNTLYWLSPAFHEKLEKYSQKVVDKR